MTRGPTITYVTDPSLDADKQLRLIGELVNLANMCRIRLAIRLPEASDNEVEALLTWYLGEASDRELPTPLVANRPEISGKYPQVQSWLPSRFLVSGSRANIYSVHDQSEMQRAIELGAHEVIYGHVFETASHPGESGRGLESLRKIASIPNIGITAIGGIDEHSIADVAKTGVDSVACIRAISQSANIAATIKAMNENWKRNQQ